MPTLSFSAPLTAFLYLYGVLYASDRDNALKRRKMNASGVEVSGLIKST